MKSIDELGISSAPWSVDDWGDETNLDVRIRDANEDEIAQPFASYADARLVATAPELYQALVGCVSVLEDIARDEGWDFNELTIAKKAIAKAAGEEV